MRCIKCNKMLSTRCNISKSGMCSACSMREQTKKRQASNKKNNVEDN